MRTLVAPFLLAAVVSTTAAAQQVNLNLDAVAAKASDKTELNLEGPALELIKTAMSQKEKGLYYGIRGFSLRNYTFAKDGEYSDRDLESLRKQLGSASGWSRVLGAKDQDGNTEIYVLSQGGQPAGFLLIAAEPKELTVIQVSGSIQLANLEELIKSTIQYKDAAQ